MCDITMPTHSEFTCEIGDQIQIGGGIAVKVMATAGQSAIQILRTELVGRDQDSTRRDLGGRRTPGEDG